MTTAGLVERLLDPAYKGQQGLREEAATLITAQAARIEGADRDEDEAYEMGKRDGYEKAVQDIDQLTGGDGEYRYCTDHDPERHTPDAETMKHRIVERFETLNTMESVSEINEWQARATTAEAECLRLREERDAAIKSRDSWKSCIVTRDEQYNSLWKTFKLMKKAITAWDAVGEATENKDASREEGAKLLFHARSLTRSALQQGER